MSVAFSPEMIQVQNHLREKAGLELLPDPSAELYCKKCETWKPDDEFYRREAERSTHRRGRTYACKKCSNEYRVKLRMDNPEREHEIDRRRKRRMREKAQKGLSSDSLVRCVCGETFRTLGLASHRRICRPWLDSQKDDR